MPVKPKGIELLLHAKGCHLSDPSHKRLGDYCVRLCHLIRMKRHGKPLFREDDRDIPHLQGVLAS